MTTLAVATLPRSIYIEPTSRCNELCQQCPRTLLSREDDRDLSFEKFRYNRRSVPCAGSRRLTRPGRAIAQ